MIRIEALIRKYLDIGVRIRSLLGFRSLAPHILIRHHIW
jgi:hypothetical protein